jgi:hypothetical protein
MCKAPADLRPRDFALLLLASGDATPRARARDQQADRAGLDLKRQLLTVLVALDPEPDDAEAALAEAVERMGPPPGPPRAVAVALLDEWRLAQVTPGWLEHQLGAAIHPPGAEGGRRGRQLPG